MCSYASKLCAWDYILDVRVFHVKLLYSTYVCACVFCMSVFVPVVSECAFCTCAVWMDGGGGMSVCLYMCISMCVSRYRSVFMHQ